MPNLLYVVAMSRGTLSMHNQTALVLCSRKSVENGVLGARMGGCLPIALCGPDNTFSLISPTRKSGAWGTLSRKFHVALKSKALGSALPGE